MRIRTHRMLAMTTSLLLGVAFVAHADEAADRAALEEATQAWVAAYNARDAGAMAALTTESVALLTSNTPIRGREAVLAAWRKATSVAKTQARVTTEETLIAKDFAWQTGSIAYALPTGPVVSRGRFFEIWNRVGGRWRLHRRMISNDAATAKTKQKPRPVPSDPVLDKPRD